jgi:hypothetical protein
VALGVVPEVRKLRNLIPTQRADPRRGRLRTALGDDGLLHVQRAVRRQEVEEAVPVRPCAGGLGVIDDVAHWLLQEVVAEADAASLDVSDREVLLHPVSSAIGEADVAQVRLREAGPGLLDVWVEVGDASIGSFEVLYPDERVELAGLARAVIDGRVELRVGPWAAGARWLGLAPVGTRGGSWPTSWPGVFVRDPIQPAASSTRRSPGSTFRPAMRGLRNPWHSSIGHVPRRTPPSRERRSRRAPRCSSGSTVPPAPGPFTGSTRPPGGMRPGTR